MEGQKIKILDLGYMEMTKEELVAGGGNATIRSPMTAVLIRHPTLGYVLYDTGNDDNWEQTYPENVRKHYPIRKLITIQDALKREGISTEEISLLILSHLHIDHAGGLKFFQGKQAGKHVIVSEDEARDAFYRVNMVPSGIDGVYVRKLFCGLDGIGFSPINGQKDLADDIRLFVMQAHTAGLIGMQLQLKNAGTILFCGDTVYTKESYEKELPPGGDLNTSSQRFLNTLRWLKEQEKKNHATIFFGHDMEQSTAWQQKGWIS